MQRFESFDKDIHGQSGMVVAIGNFDGVHRGHQALLEIARDKAQALGAKLAVLTFEPHPRDLFRPDEPPSRITPAALKAERLQAFGVDLLFSLPFDWDFASRSPANFIENVLQNGLGAAYVVVGYDFRFGQMRKGAPADIEAAGTPVTIVEPQSDAEGEVLSSSRVRQLLRQGRISEANHMLGWSWEMRGIVGKGDQRGRALGYPTANFTLDGTIHPRYGVYAVWVQVEGEQEWRKGAANIGIRPMFELEQGRVETYIFDFDADIYGKTLRVRPAQYIRSEAKFETLEALVAQMDEDCARARDILG